MATELGVIEGPCCQPWWHADRPDVISRLHEFGDGAFHFAPAGLSRRAPALVGGVATLGLHALVAGLIAGPLAVDRPERASAAPALVELRLLPAREPAPPVAEPAAALPAPDLAPLPTADIAVPDDLLAALQESPRPTATMAAPPAPTAEEWAFAGRYALKNSKAYRHTWGQQVRSMMGTAVEGPDQGMVRFRVEIAPDGSLAGLETLWSTSPEAERRAREAIAGMPPGPATPTGRPLVFERTIAFTPFAVDGPPLDRYDCLPEPTAFRNPFAWDGGSARPTAQPGPVEAPDPQALADCLAQLPKDSIEAEVARDQRLMDRWGWSAARPAR
jgi:hypothetical protein